MLHMSFYDKSVIFVRDIYIYYIFLGQEQRTTEPELLGGKIEKQPQPSHRIFIKKISSFAMFWPSPCQSKLALAQLEGKGNL